MTKEGFNIQHLLDKDWMKDFPRRTMDSMFINPADHPTIFQNERLIPPGHSQGGYIGDLFGMKVHTSEFVPSGQVFIVEQPDKFVPFTLKNESIPSLKAISGFAEMEKSLWRHMTSFFGVPARYFQDATAPYRWQRNPKETVFAWGERLSAKGLLDDPAIRWEFQKAVWKSIGLTLKRMIKR